MPSAFVLVRMGFSEQLLLTANKRRQGVTRRDCRLIRPSYYHRVLPTSLLHNSHRRTQTNCRVSHWLSLFCLPSQVPSAQGDVLCLALPLLQVHNWSATPLPR